MGTKFESLEQRRAQAEQQGIEIKENSERDIEEAHISVDALKQIEVVDEDDKMALDAAVNETKSIGKMLAETDIRAPGIEVGNSLEAVSTQAKEYGEIEKKSSDKASETVGAFEGPGVELAGKLREFGERYQELADESSRVNEEMRAEREQAASILENIDF